MGVGYSLPEAPAPNQGMGPPSRATPPRRLARSFRLYGRAEKIVQTLREIGQNAVDAAVDETLHFCGIIGVEWMYFDARHVRRCYQCRCGDAIGRLQNPTADLDTAGHRQIAADLD